MTRRCTRRTALKMLGATAAGATLPWLRSPSVFAAGSDIPLRILFIEARDGCRRNTFEPTAPGNQWVSQTQTFTDWELRDVMSALKPYRSRISMFDQLDMASARFDPTSPANAHIQGLTHMLTAAYRLDPYLGGGISIDQLIAQKLRENGANTRLASLEVMVTDDASTFKRSDQRQSYTAPGQRVPFLSYVPDVYDRIFPDGAPAASSAAASQESTAAIKAQNARRASIYNLIRSDYDRLLGRLPGDDKVKLEQMRDYREDLFKSASYVAETDRTANQPDRSLLEPFEALNGSREGTVERSNWLTQCQLMSKLVASALHTDTTRVGHISLPEMPAYLYGYKNGDFGTADSHDLTHMVSGDTPRMQNEKAWAVLDAQYSLMYEQIAFLLDELDSLKEVDGSSLLDHTLVFVYSHLGDGSHDISRLPWMVIGDAHGYLKTGQYMRFPVRMNSTKEITTNMKESRVWSVHGRGHADLFVTLANAMGVPITTFGEAEHCTGAITEMLA